jgi:hypothetical protein
MHRRTAVMASFALLFFLFGLPSDSSAGSIGTGGINFSSSGGGMSTGAADARYLMLDATNDPLTGALTLSGGTVALPGLNFGDADTGISSIAPNDLTFSTNGAYKLEIASTSISATVAIGAPSFGILSGTSSFAPAGLNFSTSATGYPRVISAHASNTNEAINGGLQLYSAIDANAEYAITAGTSATATSGMILLSLAGDVDGTPARKINFLGDGSTQAGSGAVGTPTYSFLLDPDTGMYSFGANQLGFATAGVYRGGLESSGWSFEGPGGTNYGGFTAYQRVAGTPRNYISIYSTGPTYTPSGGIPADGNALFSNGAGGFSITSTHASGEIRFYRGATPDKIASIDASGIDPGATNTFDLGSSSNLWRTAYLTSLDVADGSAAAPAIIGGNANSGLYFSGAAMFLAASGVNVMDFPTGVGGTFAIKSATTLAAGVDLSLLGGTGQILGNNFNAADSTAADMKITSAASDGSEIKVFTAANGAAEVAVRLGTSNAVDAGQYLTSWCLNCNNASPTEVARIESDGDLQLDGDATVDGGDVTVNYVHVNQVVAAVPAAPVACSITYRGVVIYVDDTNDTASGFMCMCGTGADDATYAWSKVNAPGTACF